MSHSLDGLPELLTYTQVSLLVGVSTRTVRRAVKRGEFFATQAPGTSTPKGLRITRRQIEQYLSMANSDLLEKLNLAQGRRRQQREGADSRGTGFVDDYPWPGREAL